MSGKQIMCEEYVTQKLKKGDNRLAVQPVGSPWNSMVPCSRKAKWKLTCDTLGKSERYICTYHLRQFEKRFKITGWDYKVEEIKK